MIMTYAKKRIVVFVFSFLFLCLFIAPVCKASTEYGYEVYSLDNEKIHKVWDSFDMVLTNEITADCAVVNFAVSTDEYVAILTTNDRITVFDERGNIYRRFSFSGPGTSYVGWNGNNLLLFTVRGDKIIEFTLEGECVNVVGLSQDYGISIWENIKKQTSVQTPKYKYALTKDMGGLFNFFSGYTYNTLSKTDNSGNTTIIYDVNSFQTGKSIVILGIIALIACTVPFIVVYKVREFKAQNKQNNR